MPHTRLPPSPSEIRIVTQIAVAACRHQPDDLLIVSDYVSTICDMKNWDEGTCRRLTELVVTALHA